MQNPLSLLTHLGSNHHFFMKLQTDFYKQINNNSYT